jgi:hypothetical protein
VFGFIMLQHEGPVVWAVQGAAVCLVINVNMEGEGEGENTKASRLEDASAVEQGSALNWWIERWAPYTS